MLSRLMWISVAGLALIVGIAVQDGGKILGWVDDADITAKTELAISDHVDRAIDGSFDKMTVMGSDGEEIEVSAETKRAMASAVAELVKAEADLAVARVGDESEEEVQAAQARRNKARVEVDRLKDQFERLESAPQSERDALRQEIKREVREEVRASVQEAVGG